MSSDDPPEAESGPQPVGEHPKSEPLTAATDEAGGSDEERDALTGWSRDELVVELERLRERNRRLQATYERARTAQYRRTAFGLTLLGLVGVAGAAVIPSLRDVLLVLGATGLFGGLLTYYLTPERFVAASVGRGIYETMAEDRAALCAELGLTEERVYVPVGDDRTRVRLFVPQYESYEVPSADALAETLVVPADEAGRGATFTPTGRPLYESLLEALPGDPPNAPVALAQQVSDALVEQFELVERTQVESASESDRLTIGVDDSVYGPPERFDNPVVSVYAVALASQLGTPVSVEVTPVEEQRYEYSLTFRWDPDTDTA